MISHENRSKQPFPNKHQLKAPEASRTIPLMKDVSKLTKHQIKSEATRTALLKAAEEIFARDGYERAQIDEIAKKSGRTRGAFYAQYKTKEQLFFAVQERRIELATEFVTKLAAKTDSNDIHARWETLRNALADFEDDTSQILEIELKLYALRHPETLKKWQQRYCSLFFVDDYIRSLEVAPSQGRSRLESRVYALAALKSGLILSMKFIPSELSRRDVNLILREIFEGLFPEDDLPMMRKTERIASRPSKPKAKNR